MAICLPCGRRVLCLERIPEFPDGAYPKSPVKIAAIIIAILLVLAAIFLGGGSDDSSYGRTTEYEQTTPEFESTYYLSERNVNLWDYLETNLQM